MIDVSVQVGIISKGLLHNETIGYAAMGEYVSLSDNSYVFDYEIPEPALHYRANQDLINYAREKGILKNVDQNEENRSNIPKYYSDVTKPNKSAESKKDPNPVLPEADHMDKLSEEEQLLVRSRTRHKQCIFCGSGNIRNRFFHNDFYCTKCKRNFIYPPIPFL